MGAGYIGRKRGQNLLLLATGATFLAGLALAILGYFASVVTPFPGELSVSAWVQSWREPWLDTLMKVISAPGRFEIAAPIVALVAAILYFRGWRAECIAVIAATVAGRLISLGLKELVDRPRPSDGVVHVLQLTNNASFPSGHTMHYTVFFGILGIILARRLGAGISIWVIQGIFLGALLVLGLSRIYLGAHWLVDVLAGYAFGAAVVAAVMWLQAWWQGRQPQRLSKNHR